jgi:TRAP-type C4-dicarboxylate transport system substrate-binding protein
MAAVCIFQIKGGLTMKCKTCSVLLAVSIVLSCFSSSRAADVIKLTYGNYFAPTHQVGVLAGQFCDEIKKRTNGRVEVQYYPGGTLVTASKVFNGVVQGVADIGLGTGSANRGRFPLTELFDLPHGFSSGWVTGQVLNDFTAKYKPKEWEAVHVVYFHSCGPFLVQTIKKPVRNLDDLKGLKMRATSSFAVTMKALGGTPVPLEMADVYESMRRGVIDGIYGPLEQLKGWKTGELVKYVTASWKVGNGSCFYVIMNKDRWNALPPDIKKIFDEVAAQYREKYLRMWNEIDIEGREALKSQGGQIIPLSDAESAKWIKTVQPVVEEHKKELASKGYSAKEVDEYVSFIRERIDYWRKAEKERKIPTPWE